MTALLPAADINDVRPAPTPLAGGLMFLDFRVDGVEQSEVGVIQGLFDRDIVNIDLRIPNRMIVRKRNDSEDFDLDLFSDDENVSTYFQDNTENSLTPVSDSITL